MVGRQRQDFSAAVECGRGYANKSQPIVNFCQLLESNVLADRIITFWHERGFPKAQAWTEAVHRGHDGRITYGVRSNLENGFPPR